VTIENEDAGPTIMLPPRRRSVLYVPAINERALAKAAVLPCDVVIIDLEDAVAPEAKAEARSRARAALESGIFAGKEVVVRVNGFPDSGFQDGEETADALAEDLDAVVPGNPAAILFPKIRDAEEALRASHALAPHYADPAMRVWLMIETPMAVLRIAEIAATVSEEDSRLAALVMGTNDLVKEMRIPATPSRLALLHALSASVLAARAYGLDILDGVYGNIGDQPGFEAECLQGKGLGFDGKTLIHPSQIEPANRLFSPSEVEIAEATAIVAAFELPENRGKGVITVGGRMTERLHYEIARRVLAQS
jgi:citrate lyase subunit beta/citryl-CoA lyase